MYRIALLQNQSESIELSYGNVYAWFVERYPSYRWDLFTTFEASQGLLHVLVDDYDALIISSNVFNDPYVTAIWQESADIVSEFLQQGKGLLIFHQIKMIDKQYSFLPSELAVTVRIRELQGNDLGTDGNVVVGTDHVILHYPNEIDPASIVHTCLNNTRVRALYWDYVSPVYPENWYTALADPTYEPESPRPLLIVASPQSRERVVITGIPLDWQAQESALTNLLVYVTEGEHRIAVVQDPARSSLEFEYLIGTLESSKLPHARYLTRELDLSQLHPGVHDVVVLDPKWSPMDLSEAVLRGFTEVTKPEAKLVCFGATSIGQPTVTMVGGVSPFKIQYRDSLAWLKGQYLEGRWDGSFFSTVHVLDALRELGESLEPYKLDFLRYVYGHDRNGTYDDQFAATCEMLWVYFVFLIKRSKRFRRTLAWIREQMRSGQVVPLDLARAYIVFRRCKVSVDAESVERLLDNIVTDLEHLTAIELHRYLALAHLFNQPRHCRELTLRILTMQRNDGSWGEEERNRSFLTASIVDLLMQITSSPIAGSLQGLDLRNGILRAIVYIKSRRIIQVPTIEKASTVATALQAIGRFEAEMRFPIDEFLVSQKVITERASEFSAIDGATKLIAELQHRLASMRESLLKATAQAKLMEKYRNLAGYSISVLIMIVAVIVWFAVYLRIEGILRDLYVLIGRFLNEAISPYWWVGLVVLVMTSLVVMARLGILPLPIRFLANAVLSVFGTSLPTREDERPPSS